MARENQVAFAGFHEGWFVARMWGSFYILHYTRTCLLQKTWRSLEFETNQYNFVVFSLFLFLYYLLLWFTELTAMPVKGLLHIAMLLSSFLV